MHPSPWSRLPLPGRESHFGHGAVAYIGEPLDQAKPPALAPWGRLACCRSLGPIRGRILLDGFVLSFATIMRILKGEVRHVLVGFGQLEHLQARLRQHHILCLRARFLGAVQEPRNMGNGSSGSLIHFGGQTSESVLWFHFGACEQSQQRSSLSNAIDGAPGLQTVRPPQPPGRSSALTMMWVF
jgi:hypothetical protein